MKVAISQQHGHGPPAPVHISQWQDEFEPLLDLYRERQPRHVLEVGTHEGGTLYHWLQNARPGTTVVSVDWYADTVDEGQYPGADNRHLYDSWCPDGVTVIAIAGNSREPETILRAAMHGPFEWVFIDAGHRYDEVKHDWLAYGGMCPRGVVCFHDILPGMASHPSEVHRLWEDLRDDYETLEFVANPDAPWGGIGVVFLWNVSVVTPWQNHIELWDDYAAAVYAACPDEILIVDNASTPRLEFANVRVQENLGFSGASDLGLRLAVSDAVLFLNNDIALGSADHWWLEAITNQLEPGVLVGTRLRTDRHAWVDGQVMPYLDGWCLAGMRDDLLQLGGFDATLEEPAYFSDNLLCLEARAAGFTLREVRVGLEHKGGMTSRPKENPEVAAVTLRNRDVYQARARQLLGVAA